LKPLSFIIITYNRPDDTLELLQNIRQLEKAEELLQEIIIVNNNSAADYSPVKNYITSQTGFPFQFIESKENLGVAKGRNYAIQFATAPILILLDDDAVLQNKDALMQVINAFENPPADSRFTNRMPAIVSFKVLYYDTLQMQVNALPHKQFDKYKNKPAFYTYYYAGGAHAIKREVLQQAGNYPEDFFYGMEEYDLSYRILDKGYSIIYSDKIVMLHKESPQGRKPTHDKLKMMWVNKCTVAWRYLPEIYFFSTAMLWSLEFFRKAGFDFSTWFKGWKEIFAIPKKVKRQAIKIETLQYLNETNARIWY
jgi:GT2 family glycosyltransferase